MQAILYGVRRVDMQSEDGRPIKGFSCFIGYPAAGVQGDEVSKVFISDDLAQSNAWSPAVGKLVNVEFTPKGKISIIKTVQEK